MNRRQFTTLGATPFLRAQTRSRPNILFLMADQHRADCVGADGNSVIQTPNLDRIAREGALFRHAYSSTPTCTPARAALLTGMSPWNHGMIGYGKIAAKYPVEMPRVLRGAGYHTMAIGKLHYSPQRNLHGFHNALLDESGREQTVDFRSDYRSWFYSQAPGLDPGATGIGWNDYPAKAYVLPERLHPTRWTADCAVRFLEAYNRPEPFFLKVSFARPHSPYDPPQRFMDLYRDAALPAAKTGPWADRYRERNSDKPDIWRGSLGAAQIRSSRQGYYGSVSFVDEQIGRIIQELERRKLLDQTLIVYTSDHGDMTGDHNLWRKSYPYEASARVPMLVRWPGVRGRTLTNPVELRDLLATFADAAEASLSRPTDGRSLLSLFRNQAGWREWIDLEHDVCYAPENHWSALTDGKTKYVFHARDGEEQLFDLARDPDEIRNLAGEPEASSELRRWRHRLEEFYGVRGAPFVVSGRLGLRPERLQYSPNYPG